MPPTKRLGEVNQALRDAASVHEFAGQEEEWNGQEHERVHPDRHPLGHDHQRDAALGQDVDGRGAGHGEGHGKLQGEQQEEDAHQDQHHGPPRSSLRPPTSPRDETRMATSIRHAPRGSERYRYPREISMAGNSSSRWSSPG